MGPPGRIRCGSRFIIPFAAGWIAKRSSEELRRTDAHPLRGWIGHRAVRTESGGFATVDEDPGGATPGRG